MSAGRDAVVTTRVEAEPGSVLTPGDSLDTYRSRVRATRVEDTTRMAQTLLHPGRAAIVVVGPAERRTRVARVDRPLEAAVVRKRLPSLAARCLVHLLHE